MPRARPRPLLLTAVLVAASCAIVEGRAAEITHGAALNAHAPSTARPIRFVTSSDTLPLASDLTDAYTASGGSFPIEIATETSNAVIDAVLDSEADLGIAMVATSQGQTPEIPNAWGDADPKLLGWDAIVVVAYPLRKVESLSLSDLARVVGGGIDDWSDLGSGSGTIAILGRGEGSPTRDALRTFFGLDSFCPRMELLAHDAAICDAVATRPLALGWVKLSSVTDQCQILPLDEVYPSARTLRNGDYPLCLAVVLLTAPQALPEARSLARWIQSPAGQAAVARQVLPAF
ncbi:MAG: substrate-binding domain-containing protein [Anaerolineae bacterium]